jgi:hypothetical protein
METNVNRDISVSVELLSFKEDVHFMDSVTFTFSLLLAFRLGRINAVPHKPYNKKWSDANAWSVLEERISKEMAATFYKL